MGVNTDDFEQAFYRDDTQAWVSCRHGKCRADVAIPVKGAASRQIKLEILFQPCNSRGWPEGAPRQLLATHITVQPDTEGITARGGITLPFRLTPAILKASHLRLTAE